MVQELYVISPVLDFFLVPPHAQKFEFFDTFNFFFKPLADIPLISLYFSFFPTGPAGRYGEDSGETSADCSAPCVGCPERSTSLDDTNSCPAGKYMHSNLQECKPCRKGCYCLIGSTEECPASCPAGRYGGVEGGDTTATCQGKCTAGFYCPYPKPDTAATCIEGAFETDSGIKCRKSQNSYTSYESKLRCGTKKKYCPAGTISPILVTPGYYGSEGAMKSDKKNTHKTQTICPKGYYCPGGSATGSDASAAGEKVECPAGKYGSSVGLTNSECSGDCHRGYYCGGGSTHQYAAKCGSAYKYCPQGSDKPSNVPSDSYSTPESDAVDVRWGTEKCAEDTETCFFGIRYQKLTWTKTCECDSSNKICAAVVESEEVAVQDEIPTESQSEAFEAKVWAP